MRAVPFDDSGRCHGSQSAITQALLPICITCSRLTSKRNPAPIAGKCFQHKCGVWDCEQWKGHVVTVSPQADKGNPHNVACESDQQRGSGVSK